MAIETCQICNEDCTPWFHINGHICNDCYHNARIDNTGMKWISVKDRLPEHQQIILVYAHTNLGKEGWGVATFIDSIIMNEDLMKSPYAHECVDIKKNPYFFVSQEVKQHTFNNVSHWMPIPPLPEG